MVNFLPTLKQRCADWVNFKVMALCIYVVVEICFSVLKKDFEIQKFNLTKLIKYYT